MDGHSEPSEAGLASTLPADSKGPGPSIARNPLEPNRQFGGYRIVRQLGKGGMGTVYEAIHRDSRRRVALKILDHAIDSPNARKRFLREGRLAASINHPNSVYVFGAEEIEDAPVISMEIVEGGTLQNLVCRQGKLPVKQAVDFILQVIDGLEAAQTVGVLHRDVKPANCFIDHDNTVKIGDFGLSISTEPREVTNLSAEGTFLGTPAFSSPEQLRGDELDVRSDIYSVGVTLFYLLTGRTPFEAENYVQLLSRVLESPAPSPSELRRDVPRDLARVVLRCLEKQPGRRFHSYDELRRALLSFNSTAPTPATLGLRFVASAIDGTLWMFLVLCAALIWFRDVGAMPIPEMYSIYHSWGMLIAYMVNLTVYALYFGLPEGIWGATLGKAICRLRVVDREGHRAGLLRPLLRAFTFIFLPQLSLLLWLPCKWADLSDLGRTLVSAGLGYTANVLLLLMFSTVRRRNGYAAIHDLLSGTRIIQRPTTSSRLSVPVADEALPDEGHAPTVGPYFILSELPSHDVERLELAYDVTLLRKVWIRRTPSDREDGSGSKPPSRPGRLRWLTGATTDGERWDAYEASPGRALLSLLERAQPWQAVRYWLWDLSRELNAGLADDSLPAVIALDRVWITADGRAKLLDFPAPGIDATNPLLSVPPIENADFHDVRTFLNQVALAALESNSEAAALADQRSVAVPLPRHAKKILDELPRLEQPPLPEKELASSVRRTAAVSHRRRWIAFAACAAFPLLGSLVLMFGNAMTNSWARKHPEIMELRHCLVRIEQLERRPSAAEAELQALRLYISMHFGDLISDPRAMADAGVRGMLTFHHRRMLREMAANPIDATEEEFREAKRLLRDHLKKAPKTPEEAYSATMTSNAFIRIAAFANLVMWIAIPSVIASLIFRGGAVVHLLGIVFVSRTGIPVSRWRILGRSLIVWSPCVFGIAAAILLGGLCQEATATQITERTSWVLVLAALIPSVASTCLPNRGIPDRLAGTWTVPR